MPGPDGLPVPITSSGKLMPSVSRCQLEIDLSSVVFDHHHLFSLEHYLTTKLSSTYLTYCKIKTSQASKDLEKRLEVIYQSLEDLKFKEWNETEREFQARRLETYQTEIKTMRAERDSDSQKERELTRLLLGNNQK